ncbi:MAG: hypothetical protein RLN88_14100 [Ekhidna sp.]|uniref:hypothetical protein n=1 Tax=Ekhidna sp. TaxID=2608089 RepID=UPI0032EF8B8C
MKLISIAFVFFAVALSNCQDDFRTLEITKIKYGTSFGMCMGYCTQILIIENNIASKKLVSRNESDSEKSCSRSINSSEIFSQVNRERFNDLPETIGCPDCADGGSEWIEITTNIGSKKVIYEYGKEPNEVKGYIDDLRSLYEELGTCE